MDTNIINFAVYEDDKEYMGISQVALPDATWQTVTVTGAGIGGAIEVPVPAHLDSMTLTLNFQSMTKATEKLSEPRAHTLTLRVAANQINESTRALEVAALKHVLVVYPKSNKGGTVAPAAALGNSTEYTVHYWKTTIGKKVVRELDPINIIHQIGDTDYAADIREALGK